MNNDIQLEATRCAICGTTGNAKEVYASNFEPSALNAEVFSARRLPDRIHYRMVRCNSCSLLRSDPVAPSELLEDLYADSTFDYGPEVANLRTSYRRVVEESLPQGAQGRSILEVGCGNGFFLEEALAMGFTRVAGVEPSKAAVAAAAPAVRPHLVCDVMRAALFPEESFDVVSLFHVVDHLPDPVGVLTECQALLRPGGILLFVVHDITALSARTMKDRSPIVDVEHTYLYSPDTAAALLRRAGLVDPEVRPMKNVYSLAYIVQLLPLPKGVKTSLLAKAGQRLRKRTVDVRLGNLVAVGRKGTGT